MGHYPWPSVHVNVGHKHREGVTVLYHYLLSVVQLQGFPSCMLDAVGVAYRSISEDTPRLPHNHIPNLIALR